MFIKSFKRHTYSFSRDNSDVFGNTFINWICCRKWPSYDFWISQDNVARWGGQN